MASEPLTAEEFERQYAERSGVTVEALRGPPWNRVVRPCDCGEDVCQGWQSLSPEGLQIYEEREAFYNDWAKHP